MFRRTEAKGLLLQFQTRKTKTGENAYSHLLEVLLRMRQCCNHWTLCGEDRISRLMEILGDNKKLDLNSENRGYLQDLLQLAIDQQEVDLPLRYCRRITNISQGMCCLLRSPPQPRHHTLRPPLRRRMYRARHRNPAQMSHVSRATPLQERARRAPSRGQHYDPVEHRHLGHQ